ncbi:uncharacterized protein LOC124291077 [Haliotis rubra]|uniref:uncharacterized protein LOC124291077 n=1 Tax=Haliotis rubra TaxID=36100 RepID=UPI001EE57EF1|nr:uncharacterized protein LOC124291077 [Haliotis rubra]
MGNSRDDSLEQTSLDCRDAQKRTARTLQTLARALRATQKQMNNAKVLFHSTGIVSGGLSLAGAILAPFTGGLSTTLIALSGGIGIVTGAGDLATQAIEFRVVNKAIEDAQAELDRLNRKLNTLVEELTSRLKGHGMSTYEIGRILKTSGNLAYGVYSFPQKIKEAITIVRAAQKCPLCGMSLDRGHVVTDAVEGAVARASANPKLAGGVSGLKALSKSAKALRVAGGVWTAIGIGLSIKGLVEDRIKVENNVSELADELELMADKLEEC